MAELPKITSLTEEEKNPNEIEIMGTVINLQEVEQNQLKKAQNAEKALEELQTPKFYDTLRSYYSWAKNDESFKNMSHADLLQYFYEDRSWRNMNTFSMGADLYDVNRTDDPQKMKEFAYISQTFNALPSFWWNQPDRTFSDWLIDNGGALVADPINFIGFGVGGQIAKTTYKETLKQALKNKIAKEISERTIIELQKRAEKNAIGKAIKKGALTEGGVGGVIALGQDAILQNTAIKTGVQDEFSLKQSALATGAGFGLGTVFGAGFSYGGFKLTSRQLKNNTIKNLNDLHEYGRDSITGKQLFDDLTITKKENQFYKNLSKQDIDNIEARSTVKGKNPADLAEKMLNALSRPIRTDSKPPKEPFNFTKYDNTQTTRYLRYLSNEILSDVESGKITFAEIEVMAERYGKDPKALMKLMKSRAKEDRDLAAQIVAHADFMFRVTDDYIKLTQLYSDVGTSAAEKIKLRKKLAIYEDYLNDIIVTQKQEQKNIAVAQAAGRITKDKQRATELIVNPEDPRWKDLKLQDKDAYYEAVSKLDDNNHVILSLQHAKKVGKWDLAAEYVNNNLLSSPDTHILNIISGLTQTQWKPFVMLLRAANLTLSDKGRAAVVAREALETYVYQYVYTFHALKRMAKSFYIGRPILDATQMKYDSNVRQGQLQRWINSIGESITSPLGVAGALLQRGIVNPLAYGVSLPMRVLSAGDEFLKTMFYKARMTAQINSIIMRNHPEVLGGNLSSFKNRFANRAEYKKLFKQYEKQYTSKSGEAIPTAELNIRGLTDADQTKINDPLEFAREGTYTQSAYSVNPVTGKKEGKVTGWILGQSNKHKWVRVLGLHFINTPSNLLRWNFQHLPLLGRYQFQLSHMLAEEGRSGAMTEITRPFRAFGSKLGLNEAPRYINPEAAAEANARIQAGWLLWTTAVLMAINGKFTGGGNRNWKANRERENTTGWQEYSYVTDDGRYISLNRLDPIFMPFFIAADMVEGMQNFFRYNEDMPEDVERQYQELVMGVITSLSKNLTSKFYTKNIMEVGHMLFSDDITKIRHPEKILDSFIARQAFKWLPLSGGFRYLSRVTQDEQKELYDLNDRITSYQFWKDQNQMPQRNMFGEKIDRKNGWLFGLGGQTGLWSSPFAMTEFKNTATAKFFENRKFEYLPPSRVDRNTGIDLKELKHPITGQTAYDMWREKVGEVPMYYKGKKVNLKQYIEELISDPKSDLYRRSSKLYIDINGSIEDIRQQVILNIVHAAESGAYKLMFKEFPILEETMKKRGLNIQNIQSDYLETFLKAVNQ
jgi:hypothetical protein